jgi:hypothetical protein
MPKKKETSRTETPAPAKAAAAKPETPKPAAAGTMGGRSGGPLLSTPGPKVEEHAPLMSSAVKLPPPARLSDRPIQSITTGAQLPVDDKSVVSMLATPAELARFAAEVKARREREATEGPRFSFWKCPACGARVRSAADSKGGPCFRCNPRLLAAPAGRQMIAMTEVEVTIFLADEARQQELWKKAMATARAIAARKDQELSILRKARL